MKKKIIAIFVIALMVTVIPLVVKAHPGRTDGRGGHTNHSTGEYHYHHGYSAHDHYDMDGDGKKDCPYDFKDTTDHRSNSIGNTSETKSYDVEELIVAFAVIVGLNILAYCNSYVWETWSKWLFWVCLGLTIIFLLMPFWASA